jgi:competence protein ComEA
MEISQIESKGGNMKKMRVFSILFAAVVVAMLAAGTLPAADKININTASAKELTQLDRVGPAIAAGIAEYREQNGLFEKIEDIMKVSGIGPKLFEGIKDRITVGEEENVSEEAVKTDENASQEDKAAGTKDSGTDKSPDENKPSGDKKSEG